MTCHACADAQPCADRCRLACPLRTIAGEWLEVSVAYSAYDALTLLTDDPAIDAVFSDVIMLGMTGLAVADIIEQCACASRLCWLQAVRSLRLFTTQPYHIDTILKLLRT